MAPIALGSPVNRHTQLKKFDQEAVDGFGTRAIHVGSDPDPNTGAVIPAISLSTTYKQDGVGNHKVGIFILIFPLRRSSTAPCLFVCTSCSFLTHFPYCNRATSIPGLVIPTEAPSNALSRLSSRVVHTVSLSPLDLLQPPRSFSPWVPTPISSA